MTSWQMAFNLLFGLFGSVVGWLLSMLWGAVRDLQASDAELRAELSAAKVVVAGEYATRSELDRKVDAIFAKLDRIEQKLDRKVDR